MGVDFSWNDMADLHFDPGTFKVPLPEHSAKIIISTQVLEHVPDPNAYLSEAKRLLKPDGLMILSTHGYWQEHPDPHDYWRWTSEGLMKLLRDNGWYVMEFIGVLGFASMALQLFQQAIMPKVPRALSKAFVMLMQLCVLCADSFYSAKSRLHNACVFVVAAKPARE
jgi:SAM-dependent methyltransferase